MHDDSQERSELLEDRQLQAKCSELQKDSELQQRLRTYNQISGVEINSKWASLRASAQPALALATMGGIGWLAYIRAMPMAFFTMGTLGLIFTLLVGRRPP